MGLSFVLAGDNTGNGELKADGVFGNGTVTALKVFQKLNNLGADGIAGPKTFAALNIMV